MERLNFDYVKSICKELSNGIYILVEKTTNLQYF